MAGAINFVSSSLSNERVTETPLSDQYFWAVAAKPIFSNLDNLSLQDIESEAELIPLLTSEDEETLEKEDLPENSILEIVQDGFKYGKEVIRYTKVITSRKPKPPEPEPEEKVEDIKVP